MQTHALKSDTASNLKINIGKSNSNVRNVIRRDPGDDNLPRVTGYDFRNSGNTDPNNCCRICPKPLGVAAGGRKKNGMEYEFTLEGHRPGIWYDILRTKRGTYWERTAGGAWQTFITRPSGDFDDAHNSDECLTPTNNRIYAHDGPGWGSANDSATFNPRGSTAGRTEVVQILNFTEWVNAKDPGGVENWQKISPFYRWHTINWITFSGGTWTVDPARSEIAEGSLPGNRFTDPPA